jgi:hypothetical protein
MNSTKSHRPLCGWLIALTILAWMGPRASAQVIANGSFEAGFTGWTRVDQTGSNGTYFIQSGTTSPVSGDPVPVPPHNAQAAMSDSQGPGSHVLFQEFVVPSVSLASAQLTFQVFIGNRAAAFFIPTPPSLDFSTPALNQQARVDILRAGTDPFSVAAADLLANVYQTLVNDPPVSGYTTISAELTALLNANLGATLRLRFAEVDNVFTFQMGVDNVNLTVVPIPEPTAMILCGVAVCAGLSRRYRRRATTKP